MGNTNQLAEDDNTPKLDKHQFSIVGPMADLDMQEADQDENMSIIDDRLNSMRNSKAKNGIEPNDEHENVQINSDTKEDTDNNTATSKPQRKQPASPRPRSRVLQPLNPETMAIALIPKSNRRPSISSIFHCVKQLGKGVSCRVLLVEHKQQKRIFALKEMKRSNRKNYVLFHSEVQILRQTKHPNIVELHDVYLDHYNLYICLEYCSGGTMLQHIINNSYFSEAAAKKYVHSILDTLQFMHENNIAHLDLKLNNIVFDKKQDELPDDETAKIKVIDFGLSEQIENENDIYDEIHGSLHYFPPEIFSDIGRTGTLLKAGDIWSVGVITYLMLSGKLPFFGNSQREIINCIKRGSFDWPNNVELSDECKSFISSLLNIDCEQRVTAAQALQHKWLLNDNENARELLTQQLMHKLAAVQYVNMLQEVLLQNLVAEMNEQEQTMLLRQMGQLDDAQQIMSFIETNKFSHFAHNDDDIEQLQNTMSVYLNGLASGSNAEKEENVKLDHDDPMHDLLLEGIMDEIEIDFKEYLHAEDDEDEEHQQLDPVQNSAAHTQSASETVKHETVSLDAKHSVNLSRSVFRLILDKYAEKEGINIDAMADELDPQQSGVITANAILSFNRPLSRFRYQDMQPMSPTSASGSHSPMPQSEEKGRSVHDLQDQNTITLRSSSGSNKRVRLQEIVRVEDDQDDSDSEIQITDDLYD